MTQISDFESSLTSIKIGLEELIETAEQEDLSTDDLSGALDALQTAVTSSGKTLAKVKSLKGSKAEKLLDTILNKVLFLKTNFKTSVSKTTQEKIGALQAALFLNLDAINSLHEDIQNLDRTVKQLKEENKKVRDIEFDALG